MNPNETASVVASALGQSTNHPGTARLARDLADALTRPIDPAPHDPEPFCEFTGPSECGAYVIRSNSSGKYRAWPMQESSYTHSIIHARKYTRREDAEADACPVSETVIDYTT